MHVVQVKFNSLLISGLIFVDWPKIDLATMILSSSNGLKSHLMVGYFSFLRAIQVLYYYIHRHKKCIESTMVVYRRRLSNFDTIKIRECKSKKRLILCRLAFSDFLSTTKCMNYTPSTENNITTLVMDLVVVNIILLRLKN